VKIRVPQKSIRWVVVIIILAVAGNVVFGTTGFYALFKTGKECDRLTEVVLAEQEKIDSLTTVEERLRNDPEYIERAARELLGVSRPGETVIKFVDRQE